MAYKPFDARPGIFKTVLDAQLIGVYPSTTMNPRPAVNRSLEAQQTRWTLSRLAAKAVESGPHGLATLAAGTGHPIATLRRWARVGRRFGVSRADKRLTFSHYEAVVGRPDAVAWLEQAASRNWPVGRR